MESLWDCLVLANNQVPVPTQNLTSCFNFLPSDSLNYLHLDPLSLALSSAPVPTRSAICGQCRVRYTGRLCKGQERGRVVHFGGSVRCGSGIYRTSLLRHISKFSSPELITTTSIHIPMTSKELPPLMEFVSHERASTAGNGSCPNFGHGGECHYLLSGLLGDELYSLCSPRQIYKAIHSEATQVVRGSVDSDQEQPKGWPLQEGPRVFE